MINEYYKNVQDCNTEDFNEDLIFIKARDDLKKYIDNICKSIEIIDGIEYIGSRIESDESTIKNRSFNGVEWMSLTDSRLLQIFIKFKILKDDGSYTEIEKMLFYPKLVDNYYFLLNGNKYFPILQMVDEFSYNMGTTDVIIKSTLMPLRVMRSPLSFSDDNENNYTGYVFKTKLFKVDTNVLIYLLNKFSIVDVLRIFGVNEHELLISKPNQAIDSFTTFNLNKHTSIYVKTDKINQHLDLLATLIDLLRDENIDTINKTENFWLLKLGSCFTNNSSKFIEKAEKVLLSFSRLMDVVTQHSMRIHPHHKKDTFNLLIFIIKNFNKLVSRDNNDIRNKRLRMHEYLTYSLVNRFSNVCYRMLNKNTPLTESNRMEFFSSLSPGFIVKNLKTSELLRYNNSVNCLDLFNSSLKVTQNGPSAITNGDFRISHRKIHPSFVGVFSLVFASQSHPGETLMLTPMAKLKDTGWFFSDPDPDFQKI